MVKTLVHLRECSRLQKHLLYLARETLSIPAAEGENNCSKSGGGGKGRKVVLSAPPPLPPHLFAKECLPSPLLRPGIGSLKRAFFSPFSPPVARTKVLEEGEGQIAALTSFPRFCSTVRSLFLMGRQKGREASGEGLSCYKKNSRGTVKISQKNLKRRPFQLKLQSFSQVIFPRAGIPWTFSCLQK